MDKKPSLTLTIVLILLTTLAVPAAGFLGLMYVLSMFQAPSAMVTALVLPVIVIVIGTARSIWHRRWLASSATTTVVCVILMLIIVTQLVNSQS